MDQITHHSPVIEDRIVFWALALTWPIYLVGGLYVLGPVLGVGLTGLLCLRVYLSGGGRPSDLILRVPIGAWVWGGGMLVMLLALSLIHI